jgi:aminopeptidase-like protein
VNKFNFSSLSDNNASVWMYSFISDLYPICRSITGEGVRRTLREIQKHIPLAVHEVKSGIQVFDWTVPKEWNIRKAFIRTPRGEKIADLRENNLHLVSYSVPVRRTMTLAELKSHLHTLPEHPEWIPFRTSYYREEWGFCMSHSQFESLEEGEYEVVIDSSLKPGVLNYGEFFLPGEKEDEVLISCHVCHPSLCNDNLSGIAVATFLAQKLQSMKLKNSYRFLFIPGTIGSITWLALNEHRVSKIKNGLVLTCLGDAGGFTYKRSRQGNAEIDRTVLAVLGETKSNFNVLEFSPYGYDERQYCSPGFNLPVGVLMRSPHGTFPEYHTSADNLEFVKQDSLEESLRTCFSLVQVLEANAVYLNQNPKCEPQLGKRGLYRSIGGEDAGRRQMAILWVLNLSDGKHDLLEIARRSEIPLEFVFQAADFLAEAGLLKAQKS